MEVNDRAQGDGALGFKLNEILAVAQSTLVPVKMHGISCTRERQ